MIGKLKGTVDSLYDDHVILDVGGVGYMVFCSSKTIATLGINKSAELIIETHVREDNISLFGFANQNEKTAFLLLRSVSGIGTRIALMILSSLTPSELQLAIAQKNKDAFRIVSGVGPKLAERILIELKDKTISSYEELHLSAISTQDSSVASDAISALTNLGVHRVEAASIISNILQDDPSISIDALIRLALQHRSSKT